MTTDQHKFDFGDQPTDANDRFEPGIESDQKKAQPTEEDIAITCDRVRRIVEATQIEPGGRATEDQQPDPAPAETSARQARAADDRWADLRELPPEPDPEPELEQNALTDSEYAPATETFSEPEDDASAFEPALEAEITATPPAHDQIDHEITSPAPEKVDGTPPLTRTDWDSPADHEMSRKGKMAWRIGVFGTLIAIPTLVFALSPFAPKETAQHHVSAMGCQFATLFDYKNMKEGEPGYHAHLDPDADGVACEVKRQRLSMGGGAGFQRP